MRSPTFKNITVTYLLSDISQIIQLTFKVILKYHCTVLQGKLLPSCSQKFDSALIKEAKKMLWNLYLSQDDWACDIIKIILQWTTVLKVLSTHSLKAFSIVIKTGETKQLLHNGICLQWPLPATFLKTWKCNMNTAHE